MNLLRRGAVLPIRAYQRFVSPLTPPSCRFRPSCSAYGAGAILAHGLGKGLVLTVWRILRCQPFARGGYDPVPPPGRWRHPERRLVPPGEG
jgi:hypothetical protein